jgi:plastocyanin
MRRTTLGALAVVAVAALAVAESAFGHSSSTPTLRGVVGPGYSISLKKAGKRVTTLKPGSYTFVISDKSSFHNFTLEQEKGGKFEKHLTSTAFKGTSKPVTIKLRRGKWKYYCSVHESQMFGFVSVK